MKDCNCNQPIPGFIPAPGKPHACVPKPCDYVKTYFIPSSLGTDEAGQPYAPKPGAYHDAFVVYEANRAIYFYDHQGVYLYITGGGVTSLNGQTGDITLGNFTISMNGEQLAQYNGSEPVAVDLPIPVLGEIATGNEGYITGDMAHTLQANIMLALANETGERKAADQALSTGLQTEATARKNADAELKTLISNEAKARELDRDNLQTNINNAVNLTTKSVELLQTNINAEVNARVKADNELRELIGQGGGSADELVEAEAKARQEADETLQTDITQNTTAINNLKNTVDSLATRSDTLETNLTDLADEVTSNADALDQNIQRDTAIAGNASTVTLTKTLGNIKDNTSSETTLSFPVANETMAGVMSPAVYTSLQNLASKVEALEGGAVEVSGLSAEPTTEELTTTWKTATGKDEVINGASILDSTNDKLWTYYTNSETWVPASTSVEVTPISIATDTTTGVVKGSNTPGMVKVEVDGTMSLNGYDDLVDAHTTLESEINSVQSQLTQEITKTEGIATDVLTNTNTISTHTTQINTNTTDITKNANDIATLQGKTNTLETQLSDAFDSIDNQSSMIAGNRSRITTLESKMATAEGNITNLQTNLGAQQTTIETLNTTVEGQTADLTQIKANIATNASNISALQTTVTEINTAIGQANARLATLVNGAGV